MESLKLFTLAIIQGITEFLPISSSAHVQIANAALGNPLKEHLLFFQLISHLATLTSIGIVLFYHILHLVRYRLQHTFSTLLIATLPLVCLAPWIGSVQAFIQKNNCLGLSLLITASLLFVSEKKWIGLPLPLWGKVGLIGIFQAAALFPGISRSGATIAAARFSHWGKMRAATFSFLLAAPAIIGGNLYEIKKLQHLPKELFPSTSLFILLFLTTLICGYLSFQFFLYWIKKHTLLPFALYCFIIGIIMLIKA